MRKVPTAVFGLLAAMSLSSLGCSDTVSKTKSESITTQPSPSTTPLAPTPLRSSTTTLSPDSISAPSPESLGPLRTLGARQACFGEQPAETMRVRCYQAAVSVPETRFTLTLTLPQVSGAAPDVAAKVNQAMVADQREYAERMIKIARDKWDQRSGPSADSTQFGYGDLTVRKLTPSVFSAVWVVGVTFLGAPYPGMFVSVFNFDLRDGSRITLAQLFDPSSDGLRLVADHAITQLRATQEEPIRPPDPTEQDVGHFTFGPAGLDITFDRGAVLAGAGGTPRITIPYSVLDKPSKGVIPRYGLS